MQNIIWIGEPYFAGELEACGFKRTHVISPGDSLYAWNDLTRLAGFVPDLVVVADTGGVPFVLGMENFPCLTMFYSVSSHIHAWHRLYAQGFDACLVSQGGDACHFNGPFLNSSFVWHMPPFAANTAEDSACKRDIDCLYLTQPANPASLAFGERLCALAHGVTAIPGKPEELYPRARIAVINSGRQIGLEFATFEAMGMGACVVTPRVSHGLDRLFVDGEHLVLYKPNDPGDAAHHVNFLLEHPELVEYIAQKGKEEIERAHRPAHRAWNFTDHVFELATYDVQAIIAKRKARAETIRLRSLAVPYVLCSRQAHTWKRAAFMAAARGKFGLNGLNS